MGESKKNNQESIQEQKQAIRARNLFFAEQGVVFQDIDSAYIDEGVRIAAGARIGAFVTISEGSVVGADAQIEMCVSIRRSVVGAGARIGQGSVIISSEIGADSALIQGCRVVDSVLAEDVSVLFSVVTESRIGRGAVVGPYAYLRPGSKIGDDVKVGDFVEIKNSSVGNGTKISHLTYVGDADLGENINLGCGVVFVNYDGREKHRSQVADGAFIGCNVNIISPVEIGEGAYVAAGTTVTGDIPAGSLSIGRVKQRIIDGWVKRRTLFQERRKK